MENFVVDSDFVVDSAYIARTKTVAIYINGLPHLVVQDLQMIHSYKRGEKGYIEAYCLGGHMTRLEYSSIDHWKAVLTELKKVL